MAGLLDFLQAASNSAASNVSGPVDGLAWLLRKAGVPVPENAVGGSTWMAQQGLTRPVEPGLLNAAGETAGLLAPIAAAAKAPQIAKGLLQMGENAAAPRMLNPQTGAVVWHGSPHKFDKFDSSKIGTGEGAQAYGHGLYLAESKDVAKGYRDKLTPGAGWGYDNVPANSLDSTTRLAATQLSQEMRGIGTANGWPDVETARQMAARKLMKQGNQEAANAVAKLDPSKIGDIEGSLYKVDLPDDAIAKMLDWDKPLSQQAQAVKALRPLAGRVKGLEDALQPFELGSTTGQTVNDYISRSLSPADAARLFKEAGIPGIRYLDGGSRGAGAGTSNYVVFPGEEGLLKILERNGGGL